MSNSCSWLKNFNALIFVFAVMVLSFGCQNKLKRVKINKGSTQGTSAAALPKFTKGKPETGVCLDLPRLVDHIHQLGTEVVRVTTYDLLIQVTNLEELKNQLTPESLAQIPFFWLKRQGPHLQLPYAKEFEDGWMHFPSKQNECASVEFTTSPGDASPAANPSNNSSLTPIMGSAQITEKSEKSLKFTIQNNPSSPQYSVLLESNESLLVTRIQPENFNFPRSNQPPVQVKANVLLTKRVQWGRLRNNVQIVRRLAEMWAAQLKESTPKQLLNILNDQKRKGGPETLVSLPLDVYMNIDHQLSN